MVNRRGLALVQPRETSGSLERWGWLATRRCPVTIIGGASQGGGRAAAIALTGDPFPCRGLVAIVSTYPDLPDVPASSRQAAARHLRAYLLTGDRDTMRDQVERLHADLTAGGVQAELDVVPGLGHEYPDDFPSRLGRALEFLLEP
jgi:predicted esterase